MSDDGQIRKDRRFIALFTVLAFVAVMAYVAAVTFLQLPDTGVKYADIAVPLLLGTVVGGIIGYLYGASHPKETQVSVPDPQAPVNVEVK